MFITLLRVQALFIVLALSSAAVLAAEKENTSATPDSESQSRLNLQDADINAVITTMAELTGKNFVVDPKVKGKVTIISGADMEPEHLYQVFLSILEVHGFVAIENGNIIKIIPDSSAKHSSVRVVTKGENLSANDEFASQVIDVNHISAAKLVPIMRPLVSPKGHLVSHAPTNTLIISDRLVNIERLKKIIRRIDQDSSSDLDIVQLEHASAGDLVRVLNSLRKKDKGKNAVTEPVVVIADERTNSILISGDKSERLQLKAIVAHLDTPMESSGDTEVVYLRYAKAKNLSAVLSGLGKDYLKKQKRLKGGKNTGATPIVNIQPYEEANALVINAPLELMRSMKSVIRQLDIRRAQVLVEVIIAEINATNDKSLGSQLVLDGTPGGGPVGVVNFGSLAKYASLAAGGSGNFLSGAADSIGTGLSLGVGEYRGNSANFGLLLSALESDDDTNILSTPSIITLDNEQAEIFVGDEISLESGVTTGSTTQTNNIERKKVGIKLIVTPQINLNDTLTLMIKQSVDDLSGTDSKGRPMTSERDIETTVQIDDGEVIILGGLMKEFFSESENKIPLLGDLPLLGAAFRTRSVNVKKTNLMVFIRPLILRDAESSLTLTHQKYNAFRGMQQQVEMSDRRLDMEQRIPVLPEFNQLLELPPPFEDKAKDAVVF